MNAELQGSVPCWLPGFQFIASSSRKHWDAQPEYYSAVNRQIYYAEHEYTLDFCSATSFRVIQLDTRENVKSALKKQPGEHLQTYILQELCSCWKQICYDDHSKIASYSRVLPLCTLVQCLNMTILATCLPTHTQKYKILREILML